MCILFSITLVNRVVRVSQGAARSAWAACGAQAARLNSLWSLWPDMAQVLSASEPFLMNVRECLNFRIHHNVWSETRVRKSKSNTTLRYAMSKCPKRLCKYYISQNTNTTSTHTQRSTRWKSTLSWFPGTGQTAGSESLFMKLGDRSSDLG